VLLEFGLKNYFSFREGATMSLRLDANCPEEISNGHHFTPVICVKGANASGKTQLLKGLAFLGDFCSESFTDDPDELISLVGFFDSENPSEFYAEFQIGSQCYRYEVSLTQVEIKREALYRTKKRQVLLFERIDNEIVSSIKEMQSLSSIVLRKNASVISTVRQHKIGNKDLDDVWRFFKFIESNVTFAGLREKLRDLHAVSKFLFSHEKMFALVKKFICECDTGVSDITIYETKDSDGAARFSPVFLHKHNGEMKPVMAMVESSGTKALYRNLASYFLALEFGSIVIADEIDINLHPMLLSKIVDLFLDEASNPRGAQLIFSTHNTEVLDQLGRYRTYLVNKINNESFAYRLDEIPGDLVRNDRPISPAYRGGKIGGIPVL
jgi:AAA15 family ATPase/GTPase